MGAFLGAAAIAIVSVGAGSARPTEAQVDVPMAVQRTQAMIVAYQLDNSGLHDLDVKLNAGEMVPGALGKVRKARIATQAAAWPSELQDKANDVVTTMMALEASLRDEDVAASAPRAHAVHDAYHDLSDAVYVWLSGATPSTPVHAH